MPAAYSEGPVHLENWTLQPLETAGYLNFDGGTASGANIVLIFPDL